MIRTLFVFFFCSAQLLSGSEASNKKIKREIFRVAGIFPKAGPKGDIDCIIRSIFNDYNNPKIKIEFESFDDEDNAAKTVEIANKIINSKKFDFVIGTRTSTEALAVAPLFEKAKIPFIVPFASHPEIVNGKKHVLRLACSSARYAKLMTDFTKVELKPSKVVALSHVDSTVSHYYTQKFPELMKDFPAEILPLKVTKDPESYSEVVKKIKKEQPDLLYAPLYTEEMLRLLRNLKDYALPLVILTHGNVYEDPNNAKDIKLPSHITIYYNGGWNERLSGPYKFSYLSYLNEKCHSYSQNLRTVSAFDSAYLLLEALNQNPHHRGTELMAALKSRKYQGVMGELNVDPQGDTIRPLYIFKVKDNQSSFFRSYQ